jgi:hypothetical protein
MNEEAMALVELQRHTKNNNRPQLEYGFILTETCSFDCFSEVKI